MFNKSDLSRDAFMKQADVGLGEDGLRTDVHQQQIQPVEDPQGAADAEIRCGQEQRCAVQPVPIAAGGQPAEKHRQKQRQDNQQNGDDGDRGPGQPDAAGRRFHGGENADPGPLWRR